MVRNLARLLGYDSKTMLTVALFTALLQGPAEVQDRSFTQGALLEVYDIGTSLYSLPKLKGGQLPNVSIVIPSVDLSGPEDFGGLTDAFYARVSGSILIEKDGEYTFGLSSDDGSRLFVGRDVVVDHDGLHGPDRKEGAISLLAGRHDILVEFFESGGGESLKLEWKKPSSDSYELVPLQVLKSVAAADRQTAPGQKDIAPLMDRNRPGDGKPLEDWHPSFNIETMTAQVIPKWGKNSGYSFSTDNIAKSLDSPSVDRLGTVARIQEGQYKGQLAFKNGKALRRGYIELFNGESQGATFRFSRGFNNRLGSLISLKGIGLAMIHEFKGQIEIATISIDDKPVFDLLAIRAFGNGLEIEFTKPLMPDMGIDVADYEVNQRSFDPTTREWTSAEQPTIIDYVSVSEGRTKAFLGIRDLKPNAVYHVWAHRGLASVDDEYLWTTEGWYTMNVVPEQMHAGRVPMQFINTLTPQEKAEGFELLFNGKDLSQFRGYQLEDVPPTWTVKDAMIELTPGPGSADLYTREMFGDFELRVDWKISKVGNSGIIYRSTEDYKASYQTGPEYQVIDDEYYPGVTPYNGAGANYALYPRNRDVLRHPGQWNRARIICKGNHVEHWLNGYKVVEYEFGSPEWKELVKNSKFDEWKRYGLNKKGHIAFQDHGNKVWYRNLRIKRL